MVGVGIAVVSMILEFIALSGMSGRSFSNDPQIQTIIDQFLQKAIKNTKSAQKDVGNSLSESNTNHTKMKKRNAQNSSSKIAQDLLQFLVNTDQKLLAVQNNWREATKENSTFIQALKDFDNALIHLNNRSTIRVGSLNHIVIDLPEFDVIRPKPVISVELDLLRESQQSSEEIENSSKNEEIFGQHLQQSTKNNDKYQPQFYEHQGNYYQIGSNIKNNNNYPEQYYENVESANRDHDRDHDHDRSKRSVEEERQNAVINLMKVVDSSLTDVRQFLNKAEQLEDSNTNLQQDSNDPNNPIVSVMKLVDQGLVKLRETFVNETDTEDTVTAIGSLLNVINQGSDMVSEALNQTTVYEWKDNAVS